MLTATLENLLTRGLPRSPRAQQLCSELAGRTLSVNVEGFVAVLVSSTGYSLRLARRPSSGPDDSPQAVSDAEISGGPVSLLTLGTQRPEEALRSRSVRISGDTDIAQKFHELARLLRPDWEEELSLLLGDLPARTLGRIGRAASGWTRRAAATTARNLAEYLAHERADLVSRSEGDHFLQGVDSLREDVDRLAARVDLLTRST
jgi:ubiquinone biosynthesis protein UbiJ